MPADVRIVDERAADPHDHSDGDDAHSDEGTDTAVNTDIHTIQCNSSNQDSLKLGHIQSTQMPYT